MFSNLGELSDYAIIWCFEKSQKILGFDKIHVAKHANLGRYNIMQSAKFMIARAKYETLHILKTYTK